MALELRAICKSYGEKNVLSGLNHRFEDGSITCIVGPSGCGKTTLLRILMGLEAPDSGSVRMSVPAVAAVFQEDRLLERFRAETNVRIALRRGFPKEEILAALDAVGLRTDAHRPVCELSGGMKRRVAIVRALLSDAPLVVMDEPFKGLDAKTKAQTAQFILRRLAGRTAIFTAHDASEASLLGADCWILKDDHPL